MKLTCPSCNREVSPEETPLKIIYDRLKAQGRFFTPCTPEEFYESCRTSGNWDDLIRHMKLWGCSSCVQKGRALIGDYRRQHYGLGGPTLMYVEVEYTCRCCGEEFVFSAREQKHWYEELGFRTDSRPVNCASCRRKIRNSKSGAQRLGELLHKGDSPTIEELEEMSEIYREMGSETKAEVAANRAKNKRKRV